MCNELSIFLGNASLLLLLFGKRKSFSTILTTIICSPHFLTFQKALLVFPVSVAQNPALLESTLKCDCKIEILLLKVLNAHLASSCPIASSTWSETLNCLTGFVHSDEWSSKSFLWVIIINPKTANSNSNIGMLNLHRMEERL